MDSPLHSTSSQSSTISKPRTKAAMKGYENFKVSIPTTGLDMQQALNRSPNPTGCKLAALADIALGNDVPHSVGLMHSPPSAVLTPMHEREPSRSTSPVSRPITPDIAQPFRTETSTILNDDEPIRSPEPPQLVHTPPPIAKVATKKKTPANRLSFKQQKKKTPKVRKPIEKPILEPRDVYDFEDSHDSMDVPIVSLSHARSKVASTTDPDDNVESIVEPPSPMPESITDAIKESVPHPLHQTSTADELNTTANSPASSYSDRDDFNYDSVSESESSVSEPKPDIASRPASRISNRSAKSINNLQKKCLIMGRIFKTAKKAEVAVAAEKPTREPAIVKKPIPKQELDKLFDSLRGNSSGGGGNIATAPASTSTAASTKKSKTSEGKVTNSSINGQITAVPSSSSSKFSESKEEKAAKRDAARRSRKPREVANMEAEWGMSMEQIIDLIGVGQRKTQRRCAANKQRTFAETWSSDEYEEFHSTKDIIALIQEAEVKARRARSRSAKNSTKKTVEQSNDGDDVNEPNIVDAVKATQQPATAAVVEEHSVDVDKKKKVKVPMISDADPRRKPTLTGKEKQAEKDKENKQSIGPATKDDSERKKKSARDESVVATVTTSAEQIGGGKKPATAKTKKATTFVGVESDDTDIDSEWSKSVKRSKIKNRRRTIAFREDDTKDTTNTAKSKRNKTPPPPSSRKFDAGKSSSSSSHNNSSSSAQPKAKGSAGIPRPMARRKRIASEMLYYWSSSSDEEFGRIKPRENYDDDNLEQHGWIVGDSHKKLVTLLAHAKGKKIEDCGVKEAIHKKKS